MILRYTGQFNTPLLTEQILDAMPDWKEDEWGSKLVLMPLASSGAYVTELDIMIPDETPQAVIDGLNALVANHDPTGETKDDQTKHAVINLAQSAAGVALQDLTAGQIKALMACLLYKAGGVNPDTMTVRPLGEWM